MGMDVSPDPVTDRPAALPGKQFREQGHQKHHHHGGTILGRAIAAIGRAGFAELRSDVGRRLSVDAAVRGSVDVFPGARTGNHHAIVNNLLHLLAHGPRLGLLLVEGIGGSRSGWVAAVDEAPAALLLGDDVLGEWVIAEGRRRSVRGTPPASQGLGLLKCRS